MDTIQAPKIPDTHIAFAKAVANLADAHGIERFALTYTPSYDTRREMGDNRNQHIRGDVRINFSSKDGRGRPCRNLAFTLEAILVQDIEKNPESFG